MEQVNRSTWFRIRFASILPVLRSLVLGIGISSTAAFAQKSLDYKLKAAFLLNFVKFTDWPASSFARTDSPIGICVPGKDPSWIRSSLVKP
jgi:hypothetical protein